MLDAHSRANLLGADILSITLVCNVAWREPRRWPGGTIPRVASHTRASAARAGLSETDPVNAAAMNAGDLLWVTGCERFDKARLPSVTGHGRCWAAGPGPGRSENRTAAARRHSFVVHFFGELGGRLSDQSVLTPTRHQLMRRTRKVPHV